MESDPKLEEKCNCAPWEDYEGRAYSTPWPQCNECKGTGIRPTKFGRELLVFIKKELDIGSSMR